MSSKSKNTIKISQTLYHIEWKWKTLLLFSGLVILGLICLVISLIPAVAQYAWIASFFSQVSTALIISGLYSGISELILKQDFLKANQENYNQVISASNENFDRLFEILDSAGKVSKENYTQVISANNERFEQLFKILHLAEVSKNIGLVNLVSQEDSFSDQQSEWIRNAKTLKVLLRDGDRWSSNYSDALTKRFNDPNPEKVTVILLLDPQSELLEINAKKINKTPQILQFEIEKTVSRLQKRAQSFTKLSILGYKYYNTYHLVLADDLIKLTFYPSSYLNFKSPSFVFQNLGEDCYYQQLKRDIEALEQDAVDLIEQQKSKGYSPN
jgi:hypothetical protein